MSARAANLRAVDTFDAQGEALRTERAEHLEPVPALSGFGSMLKYARQPLLRFEAARKRSERAVAFRVLGRSFIALFDLDAIEAVLVTQHAAFEKDQFTRDLERVLGAGLLTSHGEDWRRQRKLIAPSFQRTEVGAYGGVMVERAQTFLEQRSLGEVFDMHSAMMRLTLDVLVRALFGAEVSRAGEVERLLESLAGDYRPPAVALRLSSPEWLPLPSRRRLARVRAQLDAILLALIAERRARLRGEGTAAPRDLLGRLMLASDAQGNLSEATLRDEAMTLFLAGHETTALSLTYALRLLALHPREAERTHAELVDVLGGRPPTLLDLPNLPRVRAVLDESLRLFPPAWAIGRQPLEDVVVAGIHVPRGTQVIVSPWILHRDPRFFSEPERFQPSRWIDGPPPPRFAYLPFGAGPRVCIGRHFALAEAALILSTLLQRARFELVPQPRLVVAPSVTLRPRRAVLMKMTARAD
jgi:cytochrome P450